MLKYTFNTKLRCIDCYDITDEKIVDITGNEIKKLSENEQIFDSLNDVMKNVDKKSCIFIRTCIIDKNKLEANNMLATMDFNTFFIISVADIIDTVHTFVAINVAEIRHAKIIDKSTSADKEYWLYQYTDGNYGIEYITEKNKSYKVGDTMIIAK